MQRVSDAENLTFGSSPMEDDEAELKTTMYTRRYYCSECHFESIKPKVFLQHQKLDHAATFEIYACDMCEYASRHRGKVERHKCLRHNLKGAVVQRFNENIANQPAESEVPEDVHDDDSNSVVTQFNNIKDFLEEACGICGWLGQSLLEVTQHVETEHADRVTVTRTGTETHFQCSLCSFSTAHSHELAAHARRHSPTSKVFFCNECDYSTPMQNNYKRHARRHTSSDRFVCPSCSFSSPHEATVKRHACLYHRSLNLDDRAESFSPIDLGNQSTEGILDLSFATTQAMIEPEPVALPTPKDTALQPAISSFSQYRALLQETHAATFSASGPRIATTEFDQSGGNRRKRKPGQIIHIPRAGEYQGVINSWMSPFKSRALSDPSPAHSHLVDHLPSPPSLCGPPHFNTLRPLALERQKGDDGDHQALPCLVCGEPLPSLGELQQHVATVHMPENGARPNIFSHGPTPSLGIPRDLSLSVKQQKFDEISSQRFVSAKTTLSYNCQYCGVSASTWVELQQHFSDVHRHERPYNCHMCPYATRWLCDMRMHFRKHHAAEVETADDLHAAVQLVKAATLRPTTHNLLPLKPKKNVIKAVSSHGKVPLKASTIPEKAGLIRPNTGGPIRNGDRNVSYQCTICTYKTYNAENFDIHTAYHEDLKIFKCSVCGYRCNWKWDIHKHCKSMHSDIPDAHVVLLGKEEARESLDEYRWKNARSQLCYFKCSSCTFTSSRKKLVERHIKQLHFGWPNAVVVEKSIKEGMLEKQRLSTAEQQSTATLGTPSSLQFAEARSDSAESNSSTPTPGPVGDTYQGSLDCTKENTNGNVANGENPELYSIRDQLGDEQSPKSGQKSEQYAATGQSATGEAAKLCLSSKIQDTCSRVIRCVICNFRTFSRKDFQLHRAQHSIQKRQEFENCADCSFKGIRIARHTSYCQARKLNSPKVIHIPMTYNCSECPFRTTWEWSSDAHKEKHASTRGENCRSCSFSSLSAFEIKVHQRWHQKSSSQETESQTLKSCPPPTVKKDSPLLRELLNKRQDWRCPHCPAQTTSELEHSSHAEGHRLRLGSDCIVCGFSARTLDDIATHLAVHFDTSVLPYINRLEFVKTSENCSL